VGVATGDDAAVYKLTEELAIIQTLDFFPPIVDDAFKYGEIAVANALSDVYAMGGDPVIALNIVGFPVELPKDILGNILKGGASKAIEAGVLIVGGHTVDDKEPKYGLSVTGLIRPGDQVTNTGAKPGDVLVLTKPIGSGIITTAGKAQRVSAKVLDNAIAVMSQLNREAAHAMMSVGVNACADVTGFGLLGHLRLIVNGSNVGARISLASIPVFDGVWDLLDADIAPGGTRRNLDSLEETVQWHADISDKAKLLLADAQTSGGLLISVSAAKKDALLAALETHGVAVRAVIGEIVDKSALGGNRIQVLP
jgi:selenide,water dikinase